MAGGGGSVDGSTDTSSEISWTDIRGIPDWIHRVGTSGVELITNPVSFIKATVGKWIANRLAQGLITVASTVLWAVYQPFVILEDTWDVATNAVLDATGPAGDAVLQALTDLNQSMADPVVGGGVAAPLVVWVMWVIEAAVVAFLVVQIAKLLDPR